MLASITPLGERARGRRWGITTGAFLAAATTAGAAGGALAGGLGSLLVGRGAGTVGLAVLALGLALGVAVDIGVGGMSLPSVRRQVDEDWLSRYRGVVYGAGYGAQLGLGVVTLVSSSAVYLAYLGAGLTGRVDVGLAVGGLSGAARAANLWLGRSAQDPASLVALHRRLRRLRRPALGTAVIAQLLLAGAIATAL